MGRPLGEGLRSYYKAKIEELEIQARDKQHNLRRLEAQRNDLNGKGMFQLSICSRFRVITHLLTSHAYAVRMLREELQLLQEPGSYVGEVIKVSLHAKSLPCMSSARKRAELTRTPYYASHAFYRSHAILSFLSLCCYLFTCSISYLYAGSDPAHKVCAFLCTRCMYQI